MWEQFCNRLSDLLVPPLRRLEAPIDDFFNGLPLWAGQATVLTLFGLAGLWAMTLSRKFIYLGAPDEARWRDLRLWTLAVLTPYALIYLILG